MVRLYIPHKIINIRGTSGSGKSYAVRELIKALEPAACAELQHDGTPFLAVNAEPVLGAKLFVVGSYHGGECGGCDRIHKQDDICDAVSHLANSGHVIFEGVIVGTIFSRYADLAERIMLRGYEFIWAFMDTPLDVCLHRIQERRQRRGELRPLNPVSTTDKFNATWRTYDKALERFEGNVRVIEHNGDVVAQLLGMLRE